ncbi:hypothetical protein BJY01DRAFT_215674 [Aspergillus pseudoustus]|uniref:Uncharacterized protein n=1 Tax=Aspergillus pseudoustus TaxID=1810923 RepID=A0ABR4JV73_9EURO
MVALGFPYVPGTRAQGNGSQSEIFIFGYFLFPFSWILFSWSLMEATKLIVWKDLCPGWMEELDDL